MKRLIDFIKTLTDKKYNKYVNMAFMGTMILMSNGRFGQKYFATITNGLKMIDMNFYNSFSEIESYLMVLGAKGRSSYLLLLNLDLLLVVTFFLLQATLIIKLLNSMKVSEKYQWLIVLPLARSVMDFIENIAMMINTAGFPAKSAPAIAIASFATPVKWILLWMTLSVIVVLIIRKVTIGIKHLITSRQKKKEVIL